MTVWKIFTKLVPSQTLLRSSHRGCSVKKGVFKNLRKFTGKHLCWSYFSTKLLAFRPATLLNSDSNTDVFQIFKNIYFEELLQPTASALPRIYKTLIIRSCSDFREDIVFYIIKYKLLRVHASNNEGMTI